MKNKRSIMAFSALLILAFHLWVPVMPKGPGSEIENFIRAASFVGVDIFFFLSAYSLGKAKIDNYVSFIKSRFFSVYFKYILFAILAAFVLGFGLKRFVEIITSVELFKRGGGAFLWFLPSIMILYVLLPVIKKCDEKNAALTAIALFAAWAVLSLVFTYALGYKKLFIFINRFPVFMLGFYFSKYNIFDKLRQKKGLYVTTMLALVVIGCALMKVGAYKNRLQLPFADMFYCLGIPLTIGLVMLVSYVPEGRIIKMIGSSTLETYAFQMIIGYKIMNRLLKVTKNALLVNLIIFIVIISISVTVHYTYKYIESSVKKVKT